MVMAFLQWWYGAGWRRRASLERDRLDKVMDAFSIDILAKTLFAPFRQISADQVDGPLDVQFRAWADKMVSRLVGAAVRSVTILAGVVVLLGFCAWGLLVFVLWPLVPLLPVIGIFLGLSGWLPWPI